MSHLRGLRSRQGGGQHDLARFSPKGGFTPTLYADAFTGTFLASAPTLMTDGVHSWTAFGGATYARSATNGGTLQPGANTFAMGRVTTTNSPNQTVQMTVTTRNRGPDLVFRWVDASNYMVAGWEWATTSNTFRIWKVVAGTPTVLATSSVTTHPNGDIVQVSVTAGNLITLTRNAVTVCSVTDATNATGLGAGTGGECNSDELDDWSCQT